jgi:phospholipid transport system substrate-binding protein
MFSRRSMISALLCLSGTAVGAAVGTVALSAEAKAAADHPSISYMKSVGKDLLGAHRHATNASFFRVIQRHADLPSISTFALGDYQSKLPGASRPRYQRGVGAFMARYLAAQSREYPIAKYEVIDAEVGSDKDVLVNTKVYLMSGQVFNVSWKLTWRGGGYKVRDARILGFWLTPYLKNEITGFLAKRNGDFGSLIKALGG